MQKIETLKNKSGESIYPLTSTKAVVDENGNTIEDRLVVADGEDLVTDGNVLRLKDRPNTDGMGYVILRKDKTFQEQVTRPNTIYEIRYDFDLNGAEITIPENCVLKFEGGSLRNGVIENNIRVTGVPRINCVMKGDIYDYDKNIVIIPAISQKIRMITSQEQFDEAIKEAEKGTPVKAEINKGIYYMRPTTLAASFELYGNGSVKIKQKNKRYLKSALVSVDETHYRCKLTTPISPFSLFVYHDKIIDVSEYTTLPERVNNTEYRIIGTDGNINPSFKKGDQFKLRAPEGLDIRVENKVFGSYDSAWITSKFEVNGIEDGYMLCTQISNPSVENPNLNISRYNSGIDYILYNTHKEANKIYYDEEYLYIPLWCEYVEVVERNYTPYLPTPLITSEYSISINNITFEDCSCLIHFNQNKNNFLRLCQCQVRRVASYALHIITHLDNIAPASVIESCEFTDCSYFDGNIIRIDGWDSNNFKRVADKNSRVVIDKCLLKQVENLQYKHTGHAIMANSNCDILNSEICNCTSGGMTLGYGRIEVKSCVVYNDEKFNAARRRNYSRDFGAIYCNGITTNQSAENIEYIKNNTQHTILIEGCRIYGYTSQGTDGNGIYIDVGRGDVVCKRNVISPVGLYAIDSRWVQDNEGISIPISSIRNVIEENLLMSPYRLVFGEGVDEKYRIPPKGNFVLMGNINITPTNSQDIVIEGIEDKGKFIFSTNRSNLYKTSFSNLKMLPWINFTNGEKKSFSERVFWRLSGKKAIKLTAQLPSMKSCTFKVRIQVRPDILYDIDVNVLDAEYNDSGILIGRLFDVKLTGGGVPLSIVSTQMNAECTTLDIFIFAFNFNGWYEGLLNGYIHLPENVAIDYSVEDITTDKKIAATTLLIDNKISPHMYNKVNNTTFWEAVNNFYVYIPDTYFIDGVKKYKFNKVGLYRTSGSTDERPVFVPNTYQDGLIIGFEYFDTTLNKPIWWTGTEWVEGDNQAAGIQRAGTWSQRPNADGSYLDNGFQYFLLESEPDEDPDGNPMESITGNGKPIWWIQDSRKWVDATGATVTG